MQLYPQMQDEGKIYEKSFDYSIKLAVDFVDNIRHKDLKKWKESVRNFDRNLIFCKQRDGKITVTWGIDYNASELVIDN